MNATATDLISAIASSDSAPQALQSRIGEFISPDGHMPKSDLEAVDMLIEACYRAQAIEHATVDAESCVETLVESDESHQTLPLDRNDYVACAERHVADHDTNMADNEQMANVCMTYLDELVEGGYGE